MIGTIVRVGAALLLTAVWVSPAEAQRLRVGVSLRLSDHAIANVAYGDRRPVHFSIHHDDYRHRRAQRHRKAHRKLDRQHDRDHHDLGHEHDELHYQPDYYDPVTARRVHRQWHRDAEYDHQDVHHELDHKHKRVHKKLRKDRYNRRH